jgi:hypothetical protein
MTLHRRCNGFVWGAEVGRLFPKPLSLGWFGSNLQQTSVGRGFGQHSFARR